MIKNVYTNSGFLYWSELLSQYVAIPRQYIPYTGSFALATTPPTLEVTDWAFYNDGTESGSTIIGTKNTNQTLDVDTIYLFRTGVEETSGNASKNTEPQLQYNHNSGGWNNVTAASSVVRVVTTSNITDGADTTQRLTAFTYDSTNEGFDSTTGIAGGATTDLTSNGFEALWSIQILSADVANNDTIQLKAVNSNDADADFDVYNQTDPTITVNKPAASQNLSANYLSPATTLYEPSLNPGAINISADYLAPGTTLSEPTLAGSYLMGTDYISPGTTLHEPGFSLSYTLPSDYITPGTTLYEPNVVLVGAPQNLSADYLTPGTTLYEPNVVLAGSVQNLGADYLAPATTLHEPTIDGSYAMGINYLDPGTTLYEPTLNPGAVTIAADYLAPGTNLSEPTLNAGAVNIAADYINPGTTLHEPTLAILFGVQADYLIPGTTLYEPTLSPGAVTISADYLSPGTTLYNPSVGAGVPLPTLETYELDLAISQTVSYDLSITQTVEF